MTEILRELSLLHIEIEILENKLSRLIDKMMIVKRDFDLEPLEVFWSQS